MFTARACLSAPRSKSSVTALVWPYAAAFDAGCGTGLLGPPPGVDLEKQSGCQLQTDIVLGMPLQYHTVLTALVPLHVGAVFHRQATKLTDELEEKNKLLNKGATMSSVSELEELVQALANKIRKSRQLQEKFQRLVEIKK